MLILQKKYFSLFPNLPFFSSFFTFSFFSFLHFFLNVKKGITPLLIAAQEGHKQIVEILLEKGRSNVDLAERVLFFIC